MGICWFCYWGWPKPVREIYDDALQRLDGNADALEFGPAHIVWSDENFDDDCVRWCLNEIANNRMVYELGDREVSIVKHSLERLLLVPPEMRDVPAGYAEDDDHPELYPPSFAVVAKT